MTRQHKARNGTAQHSFSQSKPRRRATNKRDRIPDARRNPEPWSCDWQRSGRREICSARRGRRCRHRGSQGVGIIFLHAAAKDLVESDLDHHQRLAALDLENAGANRIDRLSRVKLRQPENIAMLFVLGRVKLL